MTRLAVATRGPDHAAGAGWRVFVDEDVQSAALAMVVRMADRLADAPALLREIDLARARTTGPYLWQPASLSSGYAGLAVFYGYLSVARPRDGWETPAREWMSRAAAASAKQPLRHPGLHSGSSGLAFALLCLAELDGRYRPAAGRAFEIVARQALQFLPGRRPPAKAALADERDFDVITGGAGVLAALLAQPRPADVVEEAIQALVADLVTVCQPTGKPGFRSWRVPPREQDFGPSGSVHGCYDLGLAHGVLGAAAALSVAYEHGYRQDGLVAAIDNVSSWFAGRCVHDEQGINWPSRVLAAPDDEPAARQAVMMARPGWCYGAAGGTRALWLSAAPLRSSSRHRVGRSEVTGRPAARPPHPVPWAERSATGLPALCPGRAERGTAGGHSTADGRNS